MAVSSPSPTTIPTMRARTTSELTTPCASLRADDSAAALTGAIGSPRPRPTRTRTGVADHDCNEPCPQPDMTTSPVPARMRPVAATTAGPNRCSSHPPTKAPTGTATRNLTSTSAATVWDPVIVSRAKTGMSTTMPTRATPTRTLTSRDGSTMEPVSYTHLTLPTIL